jgi:hypothetical protein
MVLTAADFEQMYSSVSDLFIKNTTLNDYPIVKETTPVMTQHGVLLNQTLEKMDGKEVLEDKSIELYVEEVSGAAYALLMILENIALKIGDRQLRARIHQSYSVIMKMNKRDLIAYSKILVKEAKVHTDKLSLYKLTPELLKDFEDTVGALETLWLQQSESNAQQKMYRLELADVMRLCKEDLQKCDTFMESVRMKYPELYRSYQVIRKAKSSTEVFSRVRIIDSETKEPVLNSLVTVVSTTRSRNGKPLEVVRRKTGVLGEVRVSNSEKDILLITAEKIGYDLTSGKLVIADNRPVLLELTLKKLVIE